jgi:hypothetical protein
MLPSSETRLRLERRAEQASARQIEISQPYTLHRRAAGGGGRAAPKPVHDVQVSQAGRVVAAPQRDEPQRQARRQRIALAVLTNPKRLGLGWTSLHV